MKQSWFDGLFKDRPLFFFVKGGGGEGRELRNIERNCLQGLKRKNKLFANVIG